ncbi:hypothetical protein FKM82_025919 [Ascaphus truei]
MAAECQLVCQSLSQSMPGLPSWSYALSITSLRASSFQSKRKMKYQPLPSDADLSSIQAKCQPVCVKGCMSVCVCNLCFCVPTCVCTRMFGCASCDLLNIRSVWAETNWYRVANNNIDSSSQCALLSPNPFSSIPFFVPPFLPSSLNDRTPFSPSVSPPSCLSCTLLFLPPSPCSFLI